MNNLKVAELFAGVGGFRLGLERTKIKCLKLLGLINGNLQGKYNMPLIVIIKGLKTVYILIKI